uniref:4-coumarate--CoA ligase 1 n=1 Tax=Panagrellus redivivus TaxID=6233 RepID=A0A7E4W9P2_PANRE
MDPEIFLKAKTFHELALALFKVHGDKPAYINGHDGSTISTYADLYVNSNRFAHFLVSHAGLKHQQVVASLLPNCEHFFPVHVGTSAAGGVFTGISTQFTPHEVRYQLTNSNAVVVVTQRSYLPVIFEVAPHCPDLKIVMVIDGRVPEVPQSGAHLRIFDWDHLRNFSVNPVPALYPPIDPINDLCWLPYSSGTTGLPKGVMHTHKGYLLHYLLVIKNAIQNASNLDLAESTHSLLFLPFYHAMGFFSVWSAHIRGHALILLDKFHFSTVLGLVQKYKLQALAGVPSLLHRLARDPAVEKYDLSSIRVISSGGSKLDDETAAKMKQRFPNLIKIAQGYGMTEFVTIITVSDLSPDEPVGSCGKALEHVSIKIVNPETEQKCPEGFTGEIRVKAPYVMKGYWRASKATSESFDNEGYYKTGDIGRVTPSGYLIITDRIKDLIKVKGLQVPPAEIEEVLLDCPGLADAAVVGVPDATHGEIPKAFVVKASDDLTEEIVVNYVAERLSHYKHLKGGVHFIDEIPRTPAGKIQRRVLRDLHDDNKNKAKL